VERDEMKNKIKKYRLNVGNLTKRAKGIYKRGSNVQNLIFKQNLIEFNSEPNSRSHVNTKINAGRHECNNQL
jgi:hypothetical protein